MNINSVINKNIQEIRIEKDGIKKTIHTLTNYNKNHFCGYVVDKNYIIIFHDRRDQEGYHYIDVRSVYDINKDEELDLTHGTYAKLTNMYIKKASFSIDVVMSYLLNTACFDLKKRKYFYDYMSSYNPTITKEQIKGEVVKHYPVIEKYLNPMIYIFNKKKLERELNSNIIQFNALKQDVMKLDHIERVRNDNLNKKYIKK